MYEFLKFYDEISINYPWSLEIYHSSIMDWSITIGYKTTHVKHGETIVHVQDVDMELAFALAQVKLKEYLRNEFGGY